METDSLVVCRLQWYVAILPTGITTIYIDRGCSKSTWYVDSSHEQHDLFTARRRDISW